LARNVTRRERLGWPPSFERMTMASSIMPGVVPTKVTVAVSTSRSAPSAWRQAPSTVSQVSVGSMAIHVASDVHRAAYWFR
jgi:hypothetical protein